LVSECNDLLEFKQHEETDDTETCMEEKEIKKLRHSTSTLSSAQLHGVDPIRNQEVLIRWYL